MIFVKNILTDVAFVPYEEKLIICCDSQGHLKVYNIQSGKLVANITEEDKKRGVLNCLAVNTMK